MATRNLLTLYNYDEFIPEKFEPWMRFDESPSLGEKGPDFPLTHLDGTATQLSEVLAKNIYTIVEFGSFT